MEQTSDIETARATLLSVRDLLGQRFVARTETIRTLLIATVAQEHVLLVGPPGTAKSGLMRLYAQLCGARYFEYLLTRFSEPNELFGPVDIAKFREGVYERRIEGMLPTAEIAFLDEIFKANSAILNSLLMLLNERVYMAGSQTLRCPLLCLLGATNEIPNDDSLSAVLDRFLLRVSVPNLEPIHFQSLLRLGWQAEQERLREPLASPVPLLDAPRLRLLHRALARYESFPAPFLSAYKDMVLRLRDEGLPISDRRAVKLLKAFAASALLDGREEVDLSDLRLLRQAWNHPEQAEIIESVLEPSLEAFHAEHPESSRPGVEDLDFEQMVRELERTRGRLTGGPAVSDVELFSHLRTLHDLKAAFQALATDAAREKISAIDRLLEFLYQTGPN